MNFFTFRKMNSIILKILLVSLLLMAIIADSANYRFHKMDCVRFTCQRFRKCTARCVCYCTNIAVSSSLSPPTLPLSLSLSLSLSLCLHHCVQTIIYLLMFNIISISGRSSTSVGRPRSTDITPVLIVYDRFFHVNSDYTTSGKDYGISTFIIHS